MDRSRVIAVGSLALVTGAVLGLDAAGVLHGPLNHAFSSQSYADEAGPVAGPAQPLNVPVLADLSTTSSAPSSAALASALAPFVSAPALGKNPSVVVLDAATGQALYDRRGNVAVTPASTTKLLTSISALQSLGAQNRITTRVVSAGGSTITLVGGGDPTLASKPRKGLTATSLPALADATAKRLLVDGRRSVTLTYDASAFTGPSVPPQWPATYVSSGVVSPVSALSIDQGRLSPTSNARSTNPALSAAKAFAGLLQARKVSVVGSITQATAPANPAATPSGASTTTPNTQIASINSAPIADIVDRMLTDSDNDIAEGLAHLAGGASGGAASFAGGAQAAANTLGKLGIPAQGLVLYDGSGLARSDRIPARTLANVLALSAIDTHVELRSTVTGLAIAGYTGTLDRRFDTGAQKAVRGSTLGKSGTLTGVSALAGTLVDADGRLLVYAVMAPSVTDTLGARTAIDRLVTRVASCGCRS